MKMLDLIIAMQTWIMQCWQGSAKKSRLLWEVQKIWFALLGCKYISQSCWQTFCVGGIYNHCLFLKIIPLSTSAFIVIKYNQKEDFALWMFSEMGKSVWSARFCSEGCRCWPVAQKKGAFLFGLKEEHKNEMLGDHFTGWRRVVSGYWQNSVNPWLTTQKLSL